MNSKKAAALFFTLLLVFIAGCDTEIRIDHSNIKVKEVRLLGSADIRLDPQDPLAASLSEALLAALPETAQQKDAPYEGDFYASLSGETSLEFVLSEPIDVQFIDSDGKLLDLGVCDRLLVCLSREGTPMYASSDGVYADKAVYGLQTQPMSDLLSENDAALSYSEISLYKYGVEPLCTFGLTADRALIDGMLQSGTSGDNQFENVQADFTLYLSGSDAIRTYDCYITENGLYYVNSDDREACYAVPEETAGQFYEMLGRYKTDKQSLSAK